MSQPLTVPSGLKATQRKIWETALAIQEGDPTRPVSLFEVARRTGLKYECIKGSVRRFRKKGVGWPFPTDEGGRPRKHPQAERKSQPRPAQKASHPLLAPHERPRPTSADLERRARDADRRAVRGYVKEWKARRRATAGRVLS